jgi:hypothetical protein
MVHESNGKMGDLENGSKERDLVSASGAGVAISVIGTTVFHYVMRSVFSFDLFQRQLLTVFVAKKSTLRPLSLDKR